MISDVGVLCFFLVFRNFIQLYIDVYLLDTCLVLHGEKLYFGKIHVFRGSKICSRVCQSETANAANSSQLLSS